MDGFVLAGGESKRMGSNKAVLLLDGLPLFERAAMLLDQICGRVAIVGTIPDSITLRHVIPDVPSERRGSIVGLLAALNASRSELTAILSCDMPLMSVDALEMIAAKAAAGSEHDAFMFSDNGRVEPLCAIYRTGSARQAAASMFASGDWKLQHLASALNATTIDVSAAKALSRPIDIFLNVNTPEDFASAEAAFRPALDANSRVSIKASGGTVFDNG